MKLTPEEKKEYFIRLVESLNKDSYSSMNVSVAWKQLQEIEEKLENKFDF